MRISTISIERPVFAAMLVLGLVVLGLVSAERLDVALNPDVEFPMATVTTQLRGASPETVESEVSDPLESEINTTAGIRNLSSVSSDSFSRIFIEFELGTDVLEKAQEVREKVALARPRLPLDVEEPVVAKLDPMSSPDLSVMLGGSVSLRDLSGLAEHEVAERLERLDGVGNVTLVGARDREIRIWLDPVRLTGYGLSIEDVADSLRRENADLAGGRIESSEREWSVTTAGKIRSVDDFRSMIVAQRGGRLIHLRDVAVIEDGLAEERSIARFNGQTGVSLEVRRQSGANTVAVAQRVRAEVDAIRTSLPAGVTIQIARDTAVYIERSIESIFIDMIYGGLLVVAVVLLFLRNNRSTLIASLAIPASVISSFTFFYALGFTLNSMTLMALSLSVGLVIDDAIVVLESIYRRVERGQPVLEAADRGASQVGLAVISTTLCVCAVFVPIAFMRGMIGVWFFEFGMVVAIAVCVSTLVALTLTPMLASRMLAKKESHGAVYRMFGRALDRLDEVYRQLLGWALRRKGVTVAIAVVSIVGGCGVASTLPFDLFQPGDSGDFGVSARMPIGTPLSATDRVTRRFEAAIARHPEVRALFATVGRTTQHRPNETSIYVGVTPKTERDQSLNEIMSEIRSELHELAPEAERLTVDHMSWGDGGGNSAALSYSLRGPDLDRLERYANLLLERMRADPVFSDASSSFETGKPEIRLEIDRERAADLGVPAVTIGRTIRALLAGEKVGSFEDGGRRYDVRVQVLPEFRDDPAELELIRVRSLTGELVPIANVAEPRIGEGAVEIHRENRTRQITLFANLTAGQPLGVGTERIEAFGRELGIAPPDELQASGRARSMEEMAQAIGFAFVLAMLATYMILASLFNSFIHPFTIMVSAPLSFIGGFLALKLSGMSLDMMSSIGLLVLMGLVMKNGILLVDYIIQLRAEGRSRDEAVLEAGPVRMRPVLMTTGALVFGLLPVALGASLGSEFRRSMGVITVGGLITSTLLTLVVVPVLYTLLDQLSEWTAHTLRRLLRRHPSEVKPQPVPGSLL